MAGILDKKTRVFDYILTKEGRSQMKEGGDLRFVYATVSDRGLEYLSKQSVSSFTYNDAENYYTKSSFKISDTERFYLGFESSSTHIDKLNPEYSLLNFFSYPSFGKEISDPAGINNWVYSGSFSEVVAEMTSSFVEKISSLKIIDTFNQIESEDILLNQVGELKDITYDLNNNLDKYPTIYSSNLNLDNENTLHKDLRFSHKNNFKKLIPINKDETNLFEDESNETLNNINFIFKKYESESNLIETDNRDVSIKKIITNLEKDNKIKKRVFDVINPTENDLWITQIFEHNISDGTEIFNKLAAIDLGEFYFEDQGTRKQIFLFGKIYKKSESKTNESTDTSIPLHEKEFNLSEDYSFINIFTLVVE